MNQRCNQFFLQQSLAISCLVLVCVTEARQVPNWVSAALNRFKRQDAVVDLHNSEFCVDVSTYGDVIFEPQTRSKCDSEFVKKCETKSERVSLALDRKCRLGPGYDDTYHLLPNSFFLPYQYYGETIELCKD